jgi:hypothetical protein
MRLATWLLPRRTAYARLEEFALSLHPDKTRLIEFGRFAADRRARAGLGKPETFKFLGFLFICGKSRRGEFLVHRKSRLDRMRTRLQFGGVDGPSIVGGLNRGAACRRHRKILSAGAGITVIIGKRPTEGLLQSSSTTQRQRQ